MKKTYVFYKNYPRSNEMHDMFKALRTMQFLRQKDCADELGITYQQYQKYEYGLIKPKIDKLIKLAKFLGCEDMVLHWLQQDYKLKLTPELRHKIDCELRLGRSRPHGAAATDKSKAAVTAVADAKKALAVAVNDLWERSRRTEPKEQ